MKKIFTWLLVIYIGFVFIQSLFFKFSGSEETNIIFNTISQWMVSIGLPITFTDWFGQFGGYAIGGTELFATILLLFTSTRKLGAFLAFCVMSGAIFFHLFTPLGVNRVINETTGATDGGVLFFMACGVWLASLILLKMKKT